MYAVDLLRAELDKVKAEADGMKPKSHREERKQADLYRKCHSLGSAIDILEAAQKLKHWIRG